MPDMRHQFELLCSPNRLVRESRYGSTFQAELSLKQQAKKIWQVDQYVVPLPAVKAESLFKEGVVKDANGMRAFNERLEKKLYDYIGYQKKFNGLDPESEIKSLLPYINPCAVSVRDKYDDNIVKYHFISEPTKPLADSKYMDAKSMTFMDLLNVGKQIFDLIKGLEEADFDQEYHIGLDNLVVDAEEKIKLGAFFTQKCLEAESFDTPLCEAAKLIWHLASGKNLEYTGPNSENLNSQLPQQFISTLKAAMAAKSSINADGCSRAFSLLLSQVRTGAAQNYRINFKFIPQESTPNVENGIYPVFNIKEYFDERRQFSDIEVLTDNVNDAAMRGFEQMCLFIKERLDELDANEIKEEATLERQRKALLGYPSEVGYYKNRIDEIILKNGLGNEWKPSWYNTVTEAVYGEILGFSGISNWISGENYQDSVSCKIIGDRIYYKGRDGYLQLQPQRISKQRRDLLKRTLLLIAPKESLSKPWHEFYTVAEHLRVTIYNDNGVSKEGEDVIIFRRYVLKNLSLEEFARRGSLPVESIPMIQSMAKIGYNVCFMGPVESAKSTLMQTYQLMEDPKLEGISIETDDETQYQKLMPKAPIIQFVPSKDQESTIIERAKRSDATYIIIGEARSGLYLQLVVDAANMGTRRMKFTFHSTNPEDFAYDTAQLIVRDVGGELENSMIKIAKSVHYIFEMSSLPHERSKKRLKGLWEMYFDRDTQRILMYQLAKYVPESPDSPEHWVWNAHISDDKREIGMWENPKAFATFEQTLMKLAAVNPNTGKTEFVNPYKKGKGEA